MALQTSGQISLNDIHVEAGGSSGTSASINDSDIRELISKGDGAQNAFNEYYGASAGFEMSGGQSLTGGTTVSDYINSGGTFTIPSTSNVFATNTSHAALIIDIPCTVQLSGKVMAQGGAGGIGYQNGQAGGNAISITSTGVTIVVNSGGYIGGGGGGGAGGWRDSKASGGGGGAGGGDGGGASSSAGGLGATTAGGTGGHVGSSPARTAYGGGSGGGGAHGHSHNSPGGGGGYVMPGEGGYYSFFNTSDNTQNFNNNSDGHSTNTGNSASGGAGGSAGNAGNNAGYAGTIYSGGGGGGGWGASGGSSYNRTGGAGGKAIEDNGNSYTLTNNGTIYGATT